MLVARIHVAAHPLRMLDASAADQPTGPHTHLAPTEQAASRHADIGEHDLGRVAGAHAYPGS